MLRKRNRKEVQVYVTIKRESLIQRLEESEEGDRQIRCLQHNPENIKHLYCVHLRLDEAMESPRSHKEMRSR